MTRMLLKTVAFILFFRCIQATTTRRYRFNIRVLTITRLCETRTILAVNDKFPGPTIYVNEGDRAIIYVRNSAAHSISMHWHGVFQNRTGWYDGPSFVTQCPIQPGDSYTYNFTITGQRGTLWWHAHTKWFRATIHGAFIIRPTTWYPFVGTTRGFSLAERIIILQQWWKANIWDVEAEAVRTGGVPNISDAYAINGFPGPLYGDCSASDVARTRLRAGYTYLFRVVNAALMTDMFVAVSDHTLTVVEVDAAYVKPFETSAIVISPGQTTNFLLTAKDSGIYYLAARPYSSNKVISFDNSTTASIIEVVSKNSDTSGSSMSDLPEFPGYFDTAFVSNYNAKLRSLWGSDRLVPQYVDKKMVITVSLNVQDCADSSTCGSGRLAASMNNRSNVLPTVPMLKAYYDRTSYGVYTTDFPNRPANFDFTGTPLENLNAIKGTSMFEVPYGTTIQIILQGTSLVVAEDHPIHLHGMDFYVVGTGLGNYKSEQDDQNFNLVDPPSRNTVRVPASGWTAIRLTANNPGVWFMHCHLDLHTTWGLITALIVKDGRLRSQQLDPPPADYPSCR